MVSGTPPPPLSALGSFSNEPPDAAERGASRRGKNLETSGLSVMMQATTMAVCTSRAVQ
jgi:hypothetical protein